MDMDYVILEHIIYPDGIEFLLIGQRVYQRSDGEEWEPIDPDILNTTIPTRKARVQGILIEASN